MPLEIACFNVKSALVAAEAGADRIELCAGASVGGTTPSFDDLETLKSRTKIPVNVMIRPRGGNFTYSEEELGQITADIKLFKTLADGFVLGVLDSDNQIERRVNRELVELAGSKPCTFHRAFDEVPDLFVAADAVASCGFAAILTSGGQPNAVAGASIIAEVIERTKGKLEIVTGGGVRSVNLGELKRKTQGQWFHSSAITEEATETANLEEVKQLQHKLKN